MSVLRPQQRVRLAEIALQANCTVATVSMALNDSVRLPSRTREKIQSLAKKMGYLPNQMARSLSLGRSGILGVIVPFSVDPYYAALLDSLNMEASKRGYQLHIQFHRWSFEEEEKAIRQMIESRAEGIILFAARSDYADTWIEKSLNDSECPLGMLRHVVRPPRPGADLAGSIRKDYRKEGFLAGKEFLRLGHRRIDVLEMMPKTNFLGASRYDGVCDAAKEYPKVEIVNIFHPLNVTPKAVSQISQNGISPADFDSLIDRHIHAYLALPKRGTAVLTGNPKVAWRLLGAMRRMGLRCPEDVSVAAAGVRGAGAEGILPLTSVEYDPVYIATASVSALLRCVSDRADTTGEIIVTPELVVRETTGVPPATSSATPTRAVKIARQTNPRKIQPRQMAVA